MGDWWFANLLSAASELASSEMRREKKQQYICSTSHQSSPKAWPRICNSFKHFTFVFSTQVWHFILSLKLSFNLSDFMFFSRNSLIGCAEMKLGWELDNTFLVGNEGHIWPEVFSREGIVIPNANCVLGSINGNY